MKITTNTKDITWDKVQASKVYEFICRNFTYRAVIQFGTLPGKVESEKYAIIISEFWPLEIVSNPQNYTYTPISGKFSVHVNTEEN